MPRRPPPARRRTNEMFCNQVLVALALVVAGVSFGNDVPKGDPVASRADAGATSSFHRSGYSTNLSSFAADVVRGRANVTIVGDSINNFGQSNWMYSGYLLDWHPHRWRQIHVSPVSSAVSTGSWVGLQASVPQVIVWPGQIRAGFEDFAGTVPTTIRIAYGTGWSGRAIAAGLHRDSLAWSGGVLRDADGAGRFLRDGATERHRVVLVTSTADDCRSRWTVQSRNSAAGTSMQSHHPDVEFGSSSTPRLEWFDDTLSGSTDGLGHIASELRTGQDGSFNGTERCGFLGTIITNVDESDGLGLSYIGQGGWRAENHAYPFGDPEVPVINSAAPYAGSYSDEALRRHILAHESSHFLIWIGTNNGSVDLDDPGRTATTVGIMLDRFRRVHGEARKVDSDLTDPKFLIVAPYCNSDECPYFVPYASHLRNLASDDVSFIDLRAMVEDRFGPWSEWQETLLVDGVHPSLEGSRTFAKLLWRELVAAAGPLSDLDRSGKVDGLDFGLFLQHWGSSDPFDLADFNGDGRVRGDDLGVLFLEWGSIDE